MAKRDGLIRTWLILAAVVATSTRVHSEESPDAWIPDVLAPQYFAVWVGDVDEAVAWYSTVLGLQPAGGSEAEDGSWRIENLRNDQLFVEIVRDDRAQEVDFARGFGKVGFNVSDVDIVADRAAAATGERPRVLDFKEMDLRLVQLRDPDGNILQLSSPLAD